MTASLRELAGAARARCGWMRRPVVALVLGVGAWLCAAPMVYADIYKYVDRRGVTHFADRPLHSGFKLYMHSNGTHAAPTRPYSGRVNHRAYDAMVAETARTYDLDAALLHAVITAESDYDPYAVSRSGAVGLMQLMPATARRYGVANRADPRSNLNGGARYLRDLIKLFGNDLRLVLAAYNAGENAVMRYGNAIPPYDETQQYVSKVLRLYRQLRTSN